MESNAIFQSYVKESIDGIETIKALNISEHSKKTASEKFSQFVDSAMRYNVLSFSLDALSGAVEAIGIAVILWIGFYSVRANIITIGKLITFYSLLSSFIEPIKNIINLQPTIQAAVIAAERINDILDLDIEDSASSSTTTLKAIDLLEVKNVSFRYGNGLLILENVALSIKKGEKIAIVGQSGCGKSTLAKLFLRFYLPESGHIQINGTNIDCFDLSSLRNSIAYISQNPFFFADTIRNNLTNGNEEISDEQIEAVCKMCLANQFIETLPLGYDTVLSENGENLSNGQRQKIALARALLANPQILILDEATCNLDSVSEKKINEMLSYNFSNMSCIFITHRLSTLEGCSNIYVMESGKIIGSGTHSELMHSQDQYRELWNQQ
jgi:ABC-type bacteriocin transporter